MAALATILTGVVAVRAAAGAVSTPTKPKALGRLTSEAYVPNRAGTNSTQGSDGPKEYAGASGWRAASAAATSTGLVPLTDSGSSTRLARPNAAKALVKAAARLVLGNALILDSTVTGGANSVEAQEASADGYAVTVASAAQWDSMTTAEFRSYKVLIIGDPTCGDSVSPVTDAYSSRGAWQPAVMASGGNKVLIGTDPVYHYTGGSAPRGNVLIGNGIAYAGAGPGTGLYLDLSCSYDATHASTPVPILDGLSVHGSGQFTVIGEGSVNACATGVNIIANTGPTTGLSDADLSRWGCSVHEAFDKFPADYTPLAIAPATSGFPVDYCGTDVETHTTACGSPYILVSGSGVVSGGPSVAEQGGPPSLSEHPTTCNTPRPVNCATGTFWHTFTDFATTGDGIALSFARTYSASAVATNGPLGYGWTNNYNMTLTFDASSDAVVTDANGSELTFTPIGGGLYIAPSRVLATFKSNTDGTYTLTRDASGLSYVFSSTGQLLTESDRNGVATTLTYSGGKLTTITDASGRTTRLAYAGALISSVSDPKGSTWTYSYDAADDLTSAADSLGETWHFTYNSSHLMLTMSDPRGGTTTNVYDAASQVVQQTDPAGRVTTFAYSGDPATSAGSVTSITDPNGLVTTEQYENLQLLSLTNAAGTSLSATTNYEYDPNTLGVTKKTDPSGHVSSSSYDANGNMLTTTDALGRTTTFTYDALDNVTSKTLPSGQVSTYTYDAAGNLTADTDAAGHTTTFTYGDSAHPGDVTGITDRDGRTSTLTYDTYGDVASTSTSPRAGVTDTATSVYDADGERVCQASANATAAGVRCPAAGGARVSDTTTTVYDAVGRVTATTDPNGHTTTYTYDGNGNRLALTDANGQMTTYVYDAANELTTVKRADGTSLKYSYDPDGNQTSQTDGAGHVTKYTYDALNRQSAATDPLGRTTTTGYDLAGNRTSTVDPSGRTTTYAYDAANQFTGITYSDGTTPAVAYTYTADGLRSAMTDGTGRTTYAYDGLDRLTGQTNGAGSTTMYGYNNSGQVTSLTYPSGQTVTKTYDGSAELTSITDWLGKTFNFSYDANGNLMNQADPNGVTAASTYDNADQLTAITDKTPSTTLASYGYTRDSLGQLTAANQSGAAGTPQSYAYNSLDQLGSANGASYNYDAADNLIKLADGTTQTFDAANQLTSSTPAAATGTGGGGGTGGTTGTVATDRVVSSDQYVPSATLTSPLLTTRHTGELLLAFISVGGPDLPQHQTVSSVTGGGLTWTLASRANQQVGSAEVWQAYATGAFSGRVTATLGKGRYKGSITVASFTGAAPTVGATASGSFRPGRPAVTLTTTQTGSVVWAAGTERGLPFVVVPVPGQSVVHDLPNYNATYWTQRVDRAQRAGAKVTVSDIKPFDFCTNLTAVEIRPSGTGSTPPPVTGSGSPTTYTYDAEGNRITSSVAGGTTTVLGYDQADRLTSYGTGATYHYDGDGLRASKTVGGATTAFTWDESGSLPLLLMDGTDAYVYGPDGTPLEKITGSTPIYLLHDQQGSTRILTDASGAVVGTYAYDAYGKTTAHTGAAVATLQYDGQYTDTESGYQYLRARYYDPGTGQFVSADLAVAITGSPYAFTLGNPINLVDPYGLFSFGKLLHRISGDAAYVGLAAGVVSLAVAGCVLTACVADAAVLGGIATVGSAAVAVGTVTTVVGGAADFGATYFDCSSGESPGECTSDVGADVLDVAILGAGKYLHGALTGKYLGGELSGLSDDYVKYVDRYFGLATGLNAFVYGKITDAINGHSTNVGSPLC